MASNIITSSLLPKLVVPNQSASSFFLENLLKSNDAIALLDCDKNTKWTGKQFHQASLNVAGSLIQKVQLKTDDVIVFAAPNSDIHAIALLGVLAAGGIYCCVGSELKYNELLNVIETTKAKFIVCLKDNYHICKALFDQNEQLQNLLLIENIDENFNSKGKIYSIEEFIYNNENYDHLNLPISRSPQDIAMLMMSSGTTGKPKAMLRTNHNLIAIGTTLNHDELALYKPGDIVLSSSFCHLSGIRAFGHVISCGAILATMKNHLWEEEFPKNVEKYQITSCFLVPSQVNYLVKNKQLVHKYNINSLQDVMCGGSTLAESVYEKITNEFNLKKFRLVYGMTEVGWATQVHLSFLKYNNYKTVGQPTRGTEIKILSPENKPLSAYQNGEICIRGDQVISGYFNNEQENAKSFTSDGFLRTGDLGYYDQLNQVYLVGRIKDVINVNSEIVSPVELESVLLSHPSVIDAAVIGIQDQINGEIPKAFVILKDRNENVTEKQLIDYVSERVSKNKQLKGGVIFMDEFPITPLGKIRKNQLENIKC